MAVMRFPDSRILIFCKAPVAGSVKTRLIPHMGANAAAELHRKLALRIVGECQRAGLAPVEVWCAPDINHPFFVDLAPRGSRHRQQAGDLGERMSFAFEHCLTRPGITSAVLIGTDCPTLNAAYIERALLALQRRDAVIGPAEDGGYGLIGLRRADRAIFIGMDWGGNSVCAETCRVLNRCGYRWSLLPLIWDIDRPEDLIRYRG